jgi:hypothetical protein
MYISQRFPQGRSPVRAPLNAPAHPRADAVQTQILPTGTSTAPGLPSNPAPRPTGDHAAAKSAYRAARGAVRAG